jgi:hypothetical protein
MKSIYFPLLLITATLAITGIEVFQVPEDSGHSKIAELVFVLILASFLVLGIIYAVKRSSAIKAGFTPDDELSRAILHKSAATCFFISLIIWVSLLAINVHTNIEARYLFSYGLLGMSFLFVLFWAINNLSGMSYE